MIPFWAAIAGIMALTFGAAYWQLKRIWTRRLQTLEHDLQGISEAMGQMAEIQMKIYQKTLGNLEDMEERLMDLSVPSHDASLPLERRHHVLALSRKGMAVDDIVKRLGIPRGEADLIVGLKKLLNPAAAGASRATNEVKRYAQS
jgi:hypothetical protein